MPCKKKVSRPSKKGPINEISSLSYGMDSEDEEISKRNIILFSDGRMDNFPSHAWRMLLMDAWVLFKVRSLFQAVMVWCLFFLFLGITSVSIIGPFNHSQLYQEEILQLGTVEKDKLNSLGISEENVTSIEVSEQNTWKNGSHTEKVLSSANENRLGNLSLEFQCAMNKEMCGQTSSLALSSIIKLRNRNNMPAEDTSVSSDDHQNDKKEESFAKPQLTDATSDITSKLASLENLIHQVRAEIGRLQMDLISKAKLSAEIKIREIVHEELIEVEKEKIGLPDFALESSGGNVIGTPNTKTYAARTLVQLFGFPLWYVETSPRNAIQASVSPGECWSFEGSAGNLRIQLAAPAMIYGFSVYHIPQQISLSGDITSSPREFSVVGFQNDEQSGEILLGEYEYDRNGTPLQTFLIQRELSIAFSIVELRIHSNYGHREFTCVYRFQVHGRFSSK